MTLEEHETPVTARNRIRTVGSQLVQAELDLKRVRDEETDAEIAHGRAKAAYELGRYQAQLSPEAPAVERGGPTVADKEAWVEVRCRSLREVMLDAWAVWKAAQTRRESAKEHYDRIDTQSMLAQGLLKSIDRAFSMGTRDDA